MNKTVRSKVLLAGLIIIAGATAGTCHAAPQDNRDLQWWNTLNFSFDIAKDLDIVIDEEFRMGRDAERLVYNHTEAGLVYSGLADWLDVGVYYRQINQKGTSDSGSLKVDHNPHVDATVKWMMGDWKLANRGRISYVDNSEAKTIWRYRNLLTITTPWTVPAIEMTPYIADEQFINLDNGEFERNRLYAGLSREVVKNIRASVYYMWQASREDGGWTNINVIGSAFKFRF